MDRDLVARAQQGSREAFSEIAGQSIGRLTATARLILHDEYRAQDAVQESLVDAWRGIRALRDPDRVEAWLYRLLVRACHRQASRAWRRERVEVALSPINDPAFPADQARVDTHDQLERALRRLSDDQRAVLVLTYYLDLPIMEAATVLGIPIGTTKSRLNRAMAALRAAIDADERVPGRLMETIP